MHFFRNPEIKRDLALHIGMILFFTAAGFIFGSFFLVRGRFISVGSAYIDNSFSLRAGFLSACFAFFLCLAFTLLHLSVTFFRYRSIRLLCQEIDQILHNEEIGRAHV